MISLILPIYNQADHVRAVVEGYEEALSRAGLEHELILIPNGCEDDSAAICRDLVAGERGQVIESDQAGWGLAVRLGLSAARGSLICYTNLARTSSNDLMSLLLCAVANPGAVVKANRRIRESPLRRLGSLLYNLECRALFNLPYWDINGTPKVFPREFDKLLKLSRDDDLIDLEFCLTCKREEYPVLEVPILSSRRRGGESTTGYRSAARMYWRAYRLLGSDTRPE